MKPFKYKNNNIGAKVAVRKLLISITPEKGWKYIKNVRGVIVENINFEQYYHTSTGGNTYTTKHIIDNDCYPNYAVKLENGVTDIEGNNIVVVREWDLKFEECIEVKNPISKRDYKRALKIIEEFESYAKLKAIGKW